MAESARRAFASISSNPDGLGNNDWGQWVSGGGSSVPAEVPVLPHRCVVAVRQGEPRPNRTGPRAAESGPATAGIGSVANSFPRSSTKGGRAAPTSPDPSLPWPRAAAGSRNRWTTGSETGTRERDAAQGAAFEVRSPTTEWGAPQWRQKRKPAAFAYPHRSQKASAAGPGLGPGETGVGAAGNAGGGGGGVAGGEGGGGGGRGCHHEGGCRRGTQVILGAKARQYTTVSRLSDTPFT